MIPVALCGAGEPACRALGRASCRCLLSAAVAGRNGRPSPAVDSPFEEAPVTRFAQNVIQHDFGFPSFARSGDAELEAL
jgi:hypothetical protein